MPYKKNLPWFTIFFLMAACAPLPDMTPTFPEVSGLQAEGFDTAVRLSWTDPDREDFTSVHVTWFPEDQTSPDSLVVPRGVRAVSVPGLVNEQTYRFQVRAKYGPESSSSGLAVSATPHVPPVGTMYSTEVGRRSPVWVADDGFFLDQAPPTGLIFGVWTKIPLDWNNWGHNLDVLVVKGEGWNARCLVSNASLDGVDGELIYNANTMLFMDRENGGGLWAGDYSGYMKGGHTEAQIRGWIWVAWQILKESDRIVLRQWLKFGPNGPVIRSDQDNNDEAAFAAVRTFLKDPNNNQYEYAKVDNSNTPVDEGAPTPEEIDAWTPGNIVGLQIGKDNGNLYNAFVLEQSSQPTLEQLEALATSTAPISGAWGQWGLTWSASGPALQDLTGNGRDLTPLKPDSQFLPGLPTPTL